MSDPLVIAQTADRRPLELLPALVNRHGLIAGATGTGKTVSLQVMAEALSRIGVPSVVADVKGDLSGIAAAGSLSPKLEARLSELGLPVPSFGACPVTFWDVFGERGHPVRATVSDMGPLLLSRLFGLNETQSGVLSLVFKVADDNGLLILDLRDLRAVLQYVGDNAREFRTSYGNVSSASIGAVQRALLTIEEQGGDQFFGEPMLDVADLLRTTPDGRGIVNVIAAERLLQAPKVYASFLLWLLSELFEHLPEVGDPDVPRLVFFFDEAHLLFDDAPDALVEKIELVVRLIRSKGVGVYFVTQNPIDLPSKVLAQLGNRIQHALRAFTPRDQKTVRAAAETLCANPAFDTERAISELAVGEALVSLLDAKGVPAPVERAWMFAPGSRLGPITDDERRAIVNRSGVHGRYETPVDRESAYEKLTARAAQSATPAGTTPAPGPLPGRAQQARPGGSLSDMIFGYTGPRGGRHQGILESAARSAARSVAGSFARGLLGSLFRRRR